MKNFFFDTANINFIKDAWLKLEKHVDKQNVMGITTNPNAFYKIGKLKLNEWFEDTKKLCELVSEIRGDDYGVVYIQCPISNMNPNEVLEYAKTVSKLSDGKTKIGLKIPPHTDILKINKELQKYVETNVTGLADCSTALKCVTYGVDYISIIPGRMEEVGINAKEQIDFINQSNLNNTIIIAGSMRTIEQLKWTFQYGTVPTIGEKVWDLIFSDNNLDELINLNYTKSETYSQFTPCISSKNLELSIGFFEQMDGIGKNAI